MRDVVSRAKIREIEGNPSFWPGKSKWFCRPAEKGPLGRIMSKMLSIRPPKTKKIKNSAQSQVIKIAWKWGRQIRPPHPPTHMCGDYLRDGIRRESKCLSCLFVWLLRQKLYYYNQVYDCDSLPPLSANECDDGRIRTWSLPLRLFLMMMMIGWEYT